MPERLLSEIKTHLEYYGYEVADDEESLAVLHDTKFSFMVFPFNNGALFKTGFAVNKAAAKGISGLNFLKRANTVSEISKFSFDEMGLQVSAWFPNCYDKSVFADFFEQYIVDINEPLNIDDDLTRKLLADD